MHSSFSLVVRTVSHPSSCAQFTSYFIIATAAFGGLMATTGVLLGPSVGDSGTAGMGAGTGAASSTASSGVGVGCLGIILTAQTIYITAYLPNVSLQHPDAVGAWRFC